jgi:hypothetical protein
MRWWSAVLLAVWGLAGCAGDAPAGHVTGKKDAGVGKVEVQIGTPDPMTGLDFVRLMSGGDIALETFGQGGTHATVAVRCIGFGGKAFVDVTVENLDSDSGAQVMTVPSVRPQLLLCRDKAMEICDLLPIHVMTGGLADPDKKDGLPVRVTATVHNEAGLMASASEDGVLRKSF